MKKSFLLVVLMLAVFAFPLVAQGQQTFQFPLQGTDTISVANYPYWWNIGNFAEGPRTVSPAIMGGTLTLSIPTNSLNSACSPDNWVDLNLLVNGQVVATHQVNIGDSSAIIPFTLSAPVSGSVTFRLEETNTVCSGGGSIIIDDAGGSTLDLMDVPQPVPTMGEWGMMIFVAVAGLSSFYVLRRRKA